ncbi:MAG: glutamate 5-kinase [Clostridiales Family XIII bacterium]|jgi:glutamate 5-kinase|nr:glutamate 5-kinase [Clostridiales Family XIII bacterium]
MSSAAEVLKRSRKIVLKIGSNVLATPDGKLDSSMVDIVVDHALALMQAGKRVVIVSSGAGVSGSSVMGLGSRLKDLNFQQALCAVGQVELIEAYRKRFAAEDFLIGQLLLTHDDFEASKSALNIRNMLFTLIDEGVVPIVNENDAVSTDEITLGDNDNLAALTANLWNAHLLVLMSDIDGVYDKDPKECADAKLIETVTDLSKLQKNITTGGISTFGTGGMDSKIEAARTVDKHGIPTLIVNGKKARILRDIVEGNETGTVFALR